MRRGRNPGPGQAKLGVDQDVETVQGVIETRQLHTLHSVTGIGQEVCSLLDGLSETRMHPAVAWVGNHADSEGGNRFRALEGDWNGARIARLSPSEKGEASD